ncbi:MAG: RNA polymerase sigma factor [bacterium]|nr:RNA polymerase sigma factor [bacterium]
MRTTSETPESAAAPPVSPEERFRQLFDDYYRPVSYFFARRGFSPEECRDLAQETFINVFKGIATFRAETSHKDWVFRIAKHLWLNRMRDGATIKRRAYEVSYEDAFVDGQPMAVGELRNGSANPGPEERLLRDEQSALLRDALDQLPRQMRRCLMLRLQGEKYREIAVVLGISLQTVRSHLSQARQRLREILGEDFGERDRQVEEAT